MVFAAAVVVVIVVVAWFGLVWLADRDKRLSFIREVRDESVSSISFAASPSRSLFDDFTLSCVWQGYH